MKRPASESGDIREKRIAAWKGAAGCPLEAASLPPEATFDSTYGYMAAVRPRNRRMPAG